MLVPITGNLVKRGLFNNQKDIEVLPDQENFIEIELFNEPEIDRVKEYRYLAVDINIHMDAMASIDFNFYDGKSESAVNTLNYRIIPTCNVTILVDFKELSSSRFFLPTLPGMFKGHCIGLPNEIGTMKKVCMIVHPGTSHWFEKIVVNSCYLTNKRPEIVVKGSPMVDSMGQWIQKDWNTKSHSESDMIAYLKREYQKSIVENKYPESFSRFGGYRNLKFEATGFFHLHHDSLRWWLVDPDGYAFFSNGICYGSRMGVFGFVDGMESLFSWLPSKDDPKFHDAWTTADQIAEYVKRNGKESGEHRAMFNFARSNMIKAFGASGWWDAWVTINTARMKRWGFNTIGVGVNNYFDEHVESFLKKAQMPFVWTLKNFPQTKEKIFRDFPNVFSEEYRINAESFAKSQLTPFLDNEMMVGYFINNEPEWRFQQVNLAERVFSSRGCLESKVALIEELMKKYHEVATLNANWNTKFSSFNDLLYPQEGVDQLSQQSNEDCILLEKCLLHKYENVVAAQLKAIDSLHLNLGMRYSSPSKKVMTTCREHDIFSFNCYCKEPKTRLDECANLEDVPMIIGEWHIGGGDKGNLAHGLLSSPTQKERGKAYEYYLQRAIAHKNCVGAHYFEFNDQPLLGRFDGECMEHGLIDVCNHEFQELVQHIISTNRNMYEYATGKLMATDVEGILEVSR